MGNTSSARASILSRHLQIQGARYSAIQCPKKRREHFTFCDECLTIIQFGKLTLNYLLHALTVCLFERVYISVTSIATYCHELAFQLDRGQSWADDRQSVMIFFQELRLYIAKQCIFSKRHSKRDQQSTFALQKPQKHHSHADKTDRPQAPSIPS